MKFQKNIPFPKETRGKKPGKVKYAFGEMEIGDSAAITKSERMSIYSCLVSYNNAHKTRIKIKTATEGDGCRFWRVE